MRCLLKGKGYLNNYEKNGDVFRLLQMHQGKAISRAKERAEYLRKGHIEIVHRDSNPVTTVYELVEFLNSKRSI